MGGLKKYFKWPFKRIGRRLSSSELSLVRERLRGDTVTVVFADSRYLPVLDNWIKRAQRCSVSEFVVIALDSDLKTHLETMGIAALYRPCSSDLGGLWVHRVEVIRELLCCGFNVIHSDADAVWLKDPISYVDDLGADMCFSQGTHWPRDVHAKWGFVVCCGWFFIRSNEVTLRFYDELCKRTRIDRDDQASMNRLLSDWGVTWSIGGTYELSFRGVDFTCSTELISGISEEYRLNCKVLPHSEFQRICDSSVFAYVKHPISEKDSIDTMDVLLTYNLADSVSCV